MHKLRPVFMGLVAIGLCSGLAFAQTSQSSTTNKSTTTSKPAAAKKPATAAKPASSASAAPKPVTVPDDVNALLTKYTCLACHRADTKLVGPAYVDVAKRKYTNQKIVDLIYEPKPENWPGYPPMAPMKQVPKEDALKIATWINSLAKK